MAQDPGRVEVPLAFLGADEIPIQLCNHVVVQVQSEEEFIVTLGQVAPPILFGTMEEQIEQARGVGYIPVKVVARVSMTRHQLRRWCGRWMAR